MVAFGSNCLYFAEASFYGICCLCALRFHTDCRGALSVNLRTPLRQRLAGWWTDVWTFTPFDDNPRVRGVWLFRHETVKTPAKCDPSTDLLCILYTFPLIHSIFWYNCSPFLYTIGGRATQRELTLVHKFDPTRCKWISGEECSFSPLPFRIARHDLCWQPALPRAR